MSDRTPQIVLNDDVIIDIVRKKIADVLNVDKEIVDVSFIIRDDDLIGEELLKKIEIVIMNKTSRLGLPVLEDLDKDDSGNYSFRLSNWRY